MKRLISILAGIVAAFVIFAVLFPVFSHVADGPTAAFDNVLSSHGDPDALVSNGQRPILYMSWFWGTTAMASRHYVVYPGGRSESVGVLWHHYRDVHNILPMDATDLNKLKTLPDLPSGLPSPSLVPPRYLLIISRQQQGKWVTDYYDRRDLPKQVQAMVDMQGSYDTTQGLGYSNLE